jgi:hypothetical protein
MNIPDSFILNKFYTYSHNPTYKKFDGVYNAGCPICKEGKSLGKKKRLFFYPKTKSFYCFNCSKSWNAINWISEVSNSDIDEIKQEIIENSDSSEVLFNKTTSDLKRKPQHLPFDSINLSDNNQLSFYNNNQQVKKCLSYVKERKLDIAINKCKNYYFSISDFVHKNRLCLPFYDEKEIVFYQTRCLDDSNPKYLGKSGAEKSVFNISNIDSDLEYIFLTEGPIDSMFIKNGVGIAGLNITALQKKQLSRYPFHKRIWILDNPRIDDSSMKKTQELLEMKETVYFWSLDNKYKDLNEWCVKDDINQIDYNIIINNLYPKNF